MIPSFHFHCYIKVLIAVIIIHHLSHHSPYHERFAMNSESAFRVRFLFSHIKTFRLQTYCNLNGGWCHDWVLMECFLMTAVWETLSSFGHAVQSAAKAIIIMSFLLLLFRRRYIESPVYKMNVAAFSSSSCCRRVWCVAGLLLATRLFLLSADVGIFALHIRPSGLQRQQLGAGDGASFIFLNMWALSRLWPVRVIP